MADAYLRALTDGALRQATAPAVRFDGEADLRVHGLLRPVCAAARGRGVRAEQLLLLLKQAWRELPEARDVPRHEAGAIIEHVITICIREYYLGDAGR